MSIITRLALRAYKRKLEKRIKSGSFDKKLSWKLDMVIELLGE